MLGTSCLMRSSTILQYEYYSIYKILHDKDHCVSLLSENINVVFAMRRGNQRKKIQKAEFSSWPSLKKSKDPFLLLVCSFGTHILAKAIIIDKELQSYPLAQQINNNICVNVTSQHKHSKPQKRKSCCLVSFHLGKLIYFLNKPFAL